MRLILAILLCVVANAATTTQTSVVAESGGDYTTLSAWESGRQAAHASGNIVADDYIEIASIQGSWTGADTTAVTISGWTTGSANYLCITNSTSKHDGKRYGSSSTAYKLEVSDAGALVIFEDYVRVYGLQVASTGCTADRNVIALSSIGANNSIIIGNCILYGTSSANGAAPTGIYNTDADVVLKVFNMIAYNMKSQDAADGYGIRFANGVTVDIYNCTAFGCYRSYTQAAGTATAYNCISQDASNDGWTGTWSGDYNRSDRASDAPGANSINDTDDVLFVSTTAPNENFHLDPSEVSNPNATSVINYTSDQSSGLFSDDIDYVTRTGSWDIGADEYVAAGTSTKQVILIRTR